MDILNISNPVLTKVYNISSIGNLLWQKGDDISSISNPVLTKVDGYPKHGSPNADKYLKSWWPSFGKFFDASLTYISREQMDGCFASKACKWFPWSVDIQRRDFSSEEKKNSWGTAPMLGLSQCSGYSFSLGKMTRSLYGKPSVIQFGSW